MYVSQKLKFCLFMPSDRRYPGHKMRHHSVDDDYYSGNYGGYGYYNGYYNDKYGPHYRSQPLYRDSKYQHPNARYNQVTMYSLCCDQVEV